MAPITRHLTPVLLLVPLALPAAAQARPAEPVARAAAAGATIEGRVYEDRDASGGGLGTGDAGLDGWRVWLDRDRDGRFDRGEPSSLTGSRGGRSGSYSLHARVGHGSPLLRAAPAAGAARRWRTRSRRCTEPVRCRWSVRLGRGAVLTRKSFGWYQTATIGGSVYEDEDGNGKRDVTEFGLSGFRVWLDRDRDGTYDAGEPSDVTASISGPSGVYEITDVKPAAAAAPLRHMPTEDLGISWLCTQPATSDSHGCFSELRPRSGDQIDRDIGDRAQEAASPPTSAPRPQPPPPQIGGLHVESLVISDDGGLLTQSGVQVRVTQNGLDVEGSPHASSPDGVDFTLPVGTYHVTVTGASGYASVGTGDCDSGGNVAVTGGLTASCRVTVDDIAPALTVITKVVNDNGLSAGPEAFTTHVKTNTVPPVDAPGSPKPGSAAGAVFTVRAGQYAVSEDDPSALHYTAAITGQCTSGGLIALEVGQHKTCTVTNYDSQPSTQKLEGEWTLHTPFLGDWLIAIAQAPPYIFTGTVESTPTCGAPLVGKTILSQVTGSGLSYNGQFRLYNGDQCGDAFSNVYPALITLSDDNHGVIQAQVDGAYPQQLTRVTQCNDGVDNDDPDMLVDLDDPGCSGPFDPSE